MTSISTASTIHTQPPVDRKSKEINYSARFPTNQQRSSSSQYRYKKEVSDDDESCGKLGKLSKQKETKELPEKACGKRIGPMWKAGEACPEQVYATEESAANTARSFKAHFEGEWFVARCSKCKLIHVLPVTT